LTTDVFREIGGEELVDYQEILAVEHFVGEPPVQPLQIMLRFAETAKSSLREQKRDYGRPAAAALALLAGWA
jgi:hypothetical protein